MSAKKTDKGSGKVRTVKTKIAEEATNKEGRIKAASIRSVMLDKLLDRVEKHLTGREIKASLTEYVRLVQLRREINDDQPKEVVAKWVEKSKEENAPKK